MHFRGWIQSMNVEMTLQCVKALKGYARKAKLASKHTDQQVYIYWGHGWLHGCSVGLMIWRSRVQTLDPSCHCWAFDWRFKIQPHITDADLSKPLGLCSIVIFSNGATTWLTHAPLTQLSHQLNKEFLKFKKLRQSQYFQLHFSFTFQPTACSFIFLLDHWWYCSLPWWEDKWK